MAARRSRNVKMTRKDPLYMRETGLREAPAGELAWQALEKMSRKGVAFWWAEVSKVAIRARGVAEASRFGGQRCQKWPSERGENQEKAGKRQETSRRGHQSKGVSHGKAPKRRETTRSGPDKASERWRKGQTRTERPITVRGPETRRFWLICDSSFPAPAMRDRSLGPS